MIKETLTYKNYFDKEVTKDFYFNLNKAELTEYVAQYPGGFKDTMLHLVQERNPAKVLAQFKGLISMAYGVISDDGEQFMKSPEILARFMQSEAYPTLFTKLADDAAATSRFIKGLMPAAMSGEMELYEKAEQIRLLSSTERDAALGRLSADDRKTVVEIIKILNVKTDGSNSEVSDASES